MPNLHLFLLGRPEIVLQNDVVIKGVSTKAQALIYYLAVTKQTYSRQRLASLLWPEYPEERARNNLNVELSRLPPEIKNYLDKQRFSLAFIGGDDCELDVERFLALSHAESSLADRETAVTLYRGDFLDDFIVPDAVEFEHWVTVERESLRRRMLTLLERLAIHYTERQRYQTAMDYLRRMIEIESYREWAHRQLMALLALDGQRAAALAQYESCKTILEEELAIEPSEATAEVYQQILTGEIGPESRSLVELVPLAAERPPRPLQLPSKVEHFVGRDVLLTELATELTSEEGVRLALTGMGGIGKTTLSTQLAHLIEDNFPDGVLWGDVVDADPETILEEWAERLGYDVSGAETLEARVEALRQIVEEKRLLIVLDDMRSEARMRPLLTAVEGCTILATTRKRDLAERLGMRVRPLSELTEAESLALLTKIVGVERVEAEAAAAAEMGDILQHLPLAVEIAAQRIKSQRLRPLAEMAARLRNKAQRLSVLEIDDNRAVRISFEVSWDTLPYDLKQMFRLLAVFEGRSFSRAALAAIAELSDFMAEDKLFMLLDLSLVQDDGAKIGRRYQQHPLLADFALEKLREGRMETEAFRRMAVYFQRFAAEHQAAYERLRPEWGNMMAGMTAAHRQGVWRLVIEYADALTEPWFRRGRYTEARVGYEKSYEAALNLEDENLIATSLCQWGRACVAQNDYDDGEQALERGARIYQSTGDTAGLAEVQYHLARIAIERNEQDEAQQLLERCISIWEELGDEQKVAAGRYTLARLHYRGGRYERAKSLALQAQAAQEQGQDLEGLQRTLRLMANIWAEEKEYEKARPLAERALALAERLNQPDEVAYCLNALTAVCRKQKDYEAAAQYAEQGAAIVERTGAKKMQGLFLYELSIIKETLEEFAESLEIALEGLQIFERIQDQYSIALVSVHLGDVYLHLGRQQEADRVWRSAYGIASELGHEKLLTSLERRMNR